MTADNPESRSRQADFQDILDQASDDKARHARMVADCVVPVAQVTRKRVIASALAVAVPVLAILLAVNVFEVSFEDLIAATPSPAVAHRQAQEALDVMVKGIEGFREDYAKLPERLVEVSPPSRGEWTYSRLPGGQYQVVLKMHGQVVTFDSTQGKRVVDEPRP